MTKVKMFCTCLALLLLPALAFAGTEVDILLKKLVEKGVLTQREANEIVKETQVEIANDQTERGKILPNGDTQVALLENYKVRLGLQYRAMYNFSNIPVSGVNTADDTNAYDFFRQRMRLNIDVQPADNVGGFMQMEFRGGWGGTSPTNSDPRNVGLSLNAFNRLQSRGVRYGYIYYLPDTNSNLSAGIIPVSDQLGDTLFSSDWDFNVGGIAYTNKLGSADYRLGFVRMVDGVASANTDVQADDANLLISDINLPVGDKSKLGGHIYYFHSPRDLSLASGLAGGSVSQGWYAFTGSTSLGSVDLNGFAAINSGKFGSETSTGFAVKGEASVPVVSDAKLSLLGIYASGDKAGETNHQFRTIQGMFGTEGYWAYTHIFTPNGPSDVNDLGIGIDNGGRGLGTVQAKFSKPLTSKLTGDLIAGWFSAAEANSAGDKNMGTELATMFTYEMAKNLNLQFGGAYAMIGEFFDNSNRKADNLYEIFSRFQLQF